LYLYDLGQCGTAGRGKPPRLRQLLVYCQLCHALSCSLPLLLSGLVMMAVTAHTQQNILDMVALTDFIHRSKEQNIRKVSHVSNKKVS
jgi:hypothetical protein